MTDYINEVYSNIPESPPDGSVDITNQISYRTSWSDREILSTVFPEPNWIIPKLIPEGLTILGGRPKVGKSWMLLQIALTVKCGGRYLGYLGRSRGCSIPGSRR